MILAVVSTVVQLIVKPSEFIETKSASALVVGVPAVRLRTTAAVVRLVSAEVPFLPIQVALR